MCGRYTITLSTEDLVDVFGLDDTPTEYRPRFNVAPSQPIPVVGSKADGLRRGLSLLTWGFVPRWASDPTTGPKPINARSETVAIKAPFQSSFRSRRCLIPADGFYEWAADGRQKVPHHFRARTGEPFAFAGIWDCWKTTTRTVYSCAIITVPANDLVRPFHERMPAFLTPNVFDDWLDGRRSVAELLGLLSPFPAERMEVRRVGPTVSKASHDGPDCLQPAP